MLEKTQNGLWRATMDTPAGPAHVVGDTPSDAMHSLYLQVRDMMSEHAQRLEPK